jgi:hypothetical protein
MKRKVIEKYKIRKRKENLPKANGRGYFPWNQMIQI